MGARKYLNEAVGVLTTARRRAELHKYSKEVLYDIEVLIRACSRISDMIQEENRAKEEQEALQKIKDYEAKINARAKRAKKKIKSKPRTKKRTRKIAA